MLRYISFLIFLFYYFVACLSSILVIFSFDHLLNFSSFLVVRFVSQMAAIFPELNTPALRGHQVDPSHGILYHFQFSPHEDVEVVYNFFSFNI